ncbi:MAG TPA: threonine synthase [Vicinamibacterales bacterium]|jgi:threonine synthase
MILESTRHQSPPVTFREAVLQGLAPDGGLYLPSAIPPIDPATIDSWRGRSLQDTAVGALGHLVGDEFDRTAFERLVRDAFSFPAPTVGVADDISVLELFHGPTLAFKDFGARFLARVFGYLLAERADRATILVATSGDTGSAVAQGFFNVPNVEVVVLYPAGKVSSFQEAQMATLGGNVRAVRVSGTFDDCQRLVKEAFLDRALDSLHLSSANSINIGRLLPQAIYYFRSWLETTTRHGDEVVFVVPSGNLGNITAGVIAQRAGLRVERFVSACNVNEVLPEFLRTGVYRARPSIATVSNAMDVGDPSNFARLLALHDGSIDRLRANIWGTSVSEADTRTTMRDTYRRTGYVLDPHTAVGFAAARRFRGATGNTRPTVVLATAHPSKFAPAIREELGFEPPLPDAWRDWASKPLLADDLPDARYPTFRRYLLDQ